MDFINWFAGLRFGTFPGSCSALGGALVAGLAQEYLVMQWLWGRGFTCYMRSIHSGRHMCMIGFSFRIGRFHCFLGCGNECGAAVAVVFLLVC